MATIQISINGVLTHEIPEWKILALKHDLISPEDWITEGGINIIENRVGVGIENLKKLYAPYINGYSDEEFVLFVTSLPGYKNRATLQSEAEAAIAAEQAAQEQTG